MKDIKDYAIQVEIHETLFYYRDDIYCIHCGSLGVWSRTYDFYGQLLNYCRHCNSIFININDSRDGTKLTISSMDQEIINNFIKKENEIGPQIKEKALSYKKFNTNPIYLLEV